MPAWAGKWKGGRYYLDEQGRPVFFIERRGRTMRLATHEEDLAVGELARFLADPAAFCRPAAPRVDDPAAPVFITLDRMTLYLESIRHTVKDHRRARASYLEDWGKLGLDLRTVDRKALRAALAGFPGGHRGRAEALNAFARFLVREGDLPAWRPIASPQPPEATRAPRVAYSLRTIRQAWRGLADAPVRDVFRVRVATGLHHTEIAQLVGAPLSTDPLPEAGAAIRQLPKRGTIRGVIQVAHKNGQWHRVAVDAPTLEAVIRLRARVPDRVTMWEQLKAVGIVPSNLRHTFTTLASECGRLVHFKAGGVGRAMVAQLLGHRAGSTMTGARYEKVQIPPMLVLPLRLSSPAPRRGRT